MEYGVCSNTFFIFTILAPAAKKGVTFCVFLTLALKTTVGITPFQISNMKQTFFSMLRLLNSLGFTKSVMYFSFLRIKARKCQIYYFLNNYAITRISKKLNSPICLKNVNSSF